MSTVRRALAPALLLLLALSVLFADIAPASEQPGLDQAVQAAAERDPIEPFVEDLEDRAEVPEDEFAMASGCYVLEAAGGEGFVGLADGVFTAAASPEDAAAFHLQAFDLAKYLLLTGVDSPAFLSAENPPIPYFETAASLPQDLAEGLAIEATDALVEYAAYSAAAVTGEESLQTGVDEHVDPLTGQLVETGAALDQTVAPVRYAARGDAVVAAAEPSSAAEWVVRPGTTPGTFTFDLAADDLAEDDQGPLDPHRVARLSADGGALLLDAPEELNEEGYAATPAQEFIPRLIEDSACPEWEEIGTQVEGAPAVGEFAAGETRGYLDAHLHMMAFEFIGGTARCGRPWHPYGVAAALVDCADHEPGGRGAMLEHVLSGTDPVNGHDTAGYPEFTYWPRYNSLTHEQVYWKWMERAWRGGLRMFTNLLVDNSALCELWPLKKNSCNEMDGVRLQVLRLHELERFIDAQYGGPGEGWFRIVTDPFEAREVVNSGRLAVVMGIEISVLFDCGEYLGVARCDEADIEAELAEVHAAGVRQMELVNKFDNALSGVTGDGGTTGVVTNTGNRHETGHFIAFDNCEHVHGTEGGSDRRQLNFTDEGVPAEITGRDALVGGILAMGGQAGATPTYPEGPHCNRQGLTDLGRVLLDDMVDYGMLFDPDHMSALAGMQAVQHLAAKTERFGPEGYTGVVSSHSWADEPVYERVLGQGGVVTPYAGGVGGFVNAWRQRLEWINPDYYFGFGYGADTNGFGGQGSPYEPGITYPFTGLGGVQVDQQVSGERTFDLATDGVAHYGLYADWIQAIIDEAGADGPALREDMERGVEAYLQTWERALGIQRDACLSGGLPPSSAADVRPGTHYVDVLLALGQPADRAGDAMSFCLSNGRTLTVTLDTAGTVVRLSQA